MIRFLRRLGAARRLARLAPPLSLHSPQGRALEAGLRAQRARLLLDFVRGVMNEAEAEAVLLAAVQTVADTLARGGGSDGDEA